MRHEPRVLSPALKIAVVRKKLLAPNQYEFCDLIDFSYSGLCLASQWLEAKLGQKLDLEFYHGFNKFSSRGVVTRITAHQNFDHFGIAFIYAPRELDLLITSFIQTQSQDQAARPAVSEIGKKRLMGNRVTLPDAQIYVKKSDSASPFLLCQVDNVSKGGMGFYCSSKLHRIAPFPISVQISAHPDIAVITGIVHHMSKKRDSYYYGMEFELVSMELVQLLGTLDGIDHSD